MKREGQRWGRKEWVEGRIWWILMKREGQRRWRKEG